MKVGVYIDGFNLYYGAKYQCGQGTPGWRWLDLRKLSEQVIKAHSGWEEFTLERVVYCSARINSRDNQVGANEQNVYFRALELSGSIDKLALGRYVARVNRGPLAVPDKKGRPVLAKPQGPFMVKAGTGEDDPDATFMVSVARREEKGSDVNVASHLLIDTLEGNIDAAVVISNDSDLAFPLAEARKRLPVGTVNPTKGYPSGALRGAPTEGAGQHWWAKLSGADYKAAQLPTSVAGVTKPTPW